jgi:hypothetical protein
MTDPYFFGYGSLVNLSTHIYSDPRVAKITGWRRVWKTTTFGRSALLSIRPSAQDELVGLIAQVPKSGWRALDDREAGYHRKDVTDVMFCDAFKPQTCSVYIVSKPAEPKVEAQSPILLTYLDVVLQGFLQIYGKDGPEDFFATTDSWDRPVLDDRSDPKYPRHQVLSQDESSMVDDLLKDHGVHPFKSL